ncbi:hypothetical protein T265_05748 [Opisthorchis viverrini]|uniref:Uncharacterized protein n=1 Tax=Opisthorchis viverrini TaxID=6198 RepID=A0A074ZUS1_OPIVI|nr:hypothetical protein T265_05748 [Opisthorchis viverrini]KER27125.1 hypothetical protein T265_05748 [Opisthorchis viverrini]
MDSKSVTQPWFFRIWSTSLGIRITGQDCLPTGALVTDPDKTRPSQFQNCSLFGQPWTVNVEPPTASNVHDCICSLKRHRAPGPDDLPPALFRDGGEVLSQRLSDLFACIWEKESIPDNWGESVILPVFKKGTRSDCGNHRGISLTPVVTRLLASIVLRRLTVAREILTREQQAGFSCGYSRLMSSIFKPYRVLGLCTSEVPFVVRFLPHSNVCHVVVPIGDSFNVYKLPRLTLVAISDPVSAPITAFTASGRFVFAAAGGVIYLYRNGRYLAHEFRGHQHKITKLLAFNSSLLASVDETCLLKVWNIQTLEAVFSEQFSPDSFTITALACPLGYRNKLLFGSAQGPLQLWNVVSSKQLYWFKGFGAAVACIEPAPALDVCAIGLGDGHIYLHNIKYDISLLKFVQDGGAVTSIIFRSDSLENTELDSYLSFLADGNQDLFMVTGSTSGQVNCWQLKDKGESRPVGATQTLHWDRIVSMFYLTNGDAAGAMVTSGADNCIKVSYFDRPDGGPRTVYKRSGHFRPPNRVAFWPGGSAGGSLLLSAGQDSMLRIFSTFNEHLDKSLGRAYAPGVPDRRKSKAEDRLTWLLPAISQVSICAARAEDWDSVVAIHAGRRQATTWNFVNSTRGKHWLDPGKFSGKGGEAVRLYKHTVATPVVAPIRVISPPPVTNELLMRYLFYLPVSIFSTFNEHLDKSLGRAYAPGVPDRRKSKAEDRLTWLLPAISQVSICAARAEDWDSVVAIHAGRRQATTWNFVNSTRGKHWLDPGKFSGKGGEAVRLYKHTVATSVFITNCGNYVLLGYSSGDVFKFNLQSGLERGSYGEPTAHTSAVVGISVNNVNRQTVTVGGTEVRFWSFHKHDLLASIDLSSSALFSRFNSDTDTLAIPLTTGPIVLLDATRRRVIRRFVNSEYQSCVDLSPCIVVPLECRAELSRFKRRAISTDGRWLISAHHGDPLIKTWDIVHGRLIDCFRVSTPITSLAVSPANDFIATTHANSLGVHLWDNSGTYQRLHLHPLPDDYVPPSDRKPVAIPSRSLIAHFNEDSEHGLKSIKLGLRAASDSAHSDGDAYDECSESNDEDVDMDKEPLSNTPLWRDYVSPEQLPDKLATLSGLSSTYLSSFLQLDLIRERNRKVTTPVSAERNSGPSLPFFLPLVETAKGLAWVDADTPQDDPMLGGAESSSRQSLKRHAIWSDESLTGLEPVPGLASRIMRAKEDDEFDEIMLTLKSLGPSALDLEIRLLAPSLEEEEAVSSAVTEEFTATLHCATHERLQGFLRLLINRFERNLDVDLACVCLESVLHRHGDLILNTVCTTNTQVADKSSEIDGQIDAILSCEQHSDDFLSHPTLQLISRAVEAKEKTSTLFTRRLTRSICLVDFIRNPTTTLQF